MSKQIEAGAVAQSVSDHLAAAIDEDGNLCVGGYADDGDWEGAISTVYDHIHTVLTPSGEVGSFILETTDGRQFQVEVREIKR